MIKKILVVDDSPVARMILKSCIPSNMGYEIHEAVDGKEGIEKFKELTPDVTFMDLTMPILDGYQATAEITSLDSNAIIIVSTADIQPQSLATIKDLGAFMVIKKPPESNAIQLALAKADMQLEKLSGVL